MKTDEMTWVWIAGCAIALSIFAIKVGLGVAARMFDEAEGAARRWAFLLLTCAIYCLLFALVPVIDNLIAEEAWTRMLLGVAGYGIYAHVVVAIGLIVWGVGIMSTSGEKASSENCCLRKGGQWLLVLPCPVCAMVIIAAGLTGCKLLSISAGRAAFLLASIFLMLTLSMLVLLLPLRRQIARASEGFLGSAMATAGAFILLMIAFSPLYQEAKDVFNMALKEDATAALDLRQWLMLAGGVATLMGLGLFRYWRQSNMEKTCKL